MKKALLISTASILLTATPVFAVSNHANEHADNDHTNRPMVVVTAPVVSITPSVSPSVSPTVTPTDKDDQDKDDNKVLGASVSVTPACDPDGNYKNHGAYVSCVAHQHLGGEAVEEAAHSDIGKKHHEPTPTPSISVTPSATPSVSPTVTPTGEPVTSPSGQLETFNPLASVGDLVGRFFGFLHHLV